MQFWYQIIEDVNVDIELSDIYDTIERFLIKNNKNHTVQDIDGEFKHRTVYWLLYMYQLPDFDPQYNDGALDDLWEEWDLFIAQNYTSR